MKKFDYRNDCMLINNYVFEYLKKMRLEIEELSLIENNMMYDSAIQVMDAFDRKYSNLEYVSHRIMDDLLSKKNMETYKNQGYFSFESSKLGLDFQNDLNNIFELEKELKDFSIDYWYYEITQFNSIKNGDKFRVVAFGIDEYKNIINDIFAKSLLTCSLVSDQFIKDVESKILYITNVNFENYVSSTVVNKYSNSEAIETAICTPKVIEKICLDNSDCLNQIKLIKYESYIDGALLVGNGCDLLLDEYRFLKENKIKFKCINKGLYNSETYSNDEYIEFINKISELEHREVLSDKEKEFLVDYYNEVVVKMNYNEDIINVIKSAIAKHVDISCKTKVYR